MFDVRESSRQIPKHTHTWCLCCSQPKPTPSLNTAKKAFADPLVGSRPPGMPSHKGQAVSPAVAD